MRALAFELIFLANKIGKLSSLAVSCPRATEERRPHGEAEAAEIAGFATIRSGHDPATRRTVGSGICRRTRTRTASLRRDRHVAGGRKEGDGGQAWETGGGSVADGLRNLLDDLRQGRLSMTDTAAFAPGKNLATTPGKVVYRNRLIELINYAPMTPQTYALPLLFIPPWINKFYVLDLQPKNSLVRFLLEEGFSVFMISWKNPDASMEAITFEDYMTDGPLAASDVVREITGAERINPVGYCIGGTLLAMTLAYLAARRDDRFGAATFMVSLLDFSEVGDTAVFIDEPQIAYMEQQMLERGYLDSRGMSDMFNLLRANDLIWNTVINNYLMGNKPPAFDLLYWNNDGTRMARAAHSFYVRNTYLENNLITPGKISLLGQEIDLRRIRQDSTRWAPRRTTSCPGARPGGSRS